MSGVEHPGALALAGPGRAGTTIAAALVARGWRVVGVAGRSPDAPSTRAASARFDAPAVELADVARGADLVVIATPDAVIEAVAAALAPGVSADALVLHLSGALGLAALAAVPARTGALHPLQTLPSVEAGLAALPGSWCAIAGDPQVRAIAETLELRPIELDDADRAAYHAAACIAANHVVALLSQVEAVAPAPLEAFLPLVRAAIDNVAELGPEAALTGPVARGDVATVRGHLDVLSARDRDAYLSLARIAYELAGRTDPELEGALR